MVLAQGQAPAACLNIPPQRHQLRQNHGPHVLDGGQVQHQPDAADLPDPGVDWVEDSPHGVHVHEPGGLQPHDGHGDAVLPLVLLAPAWKRWGKATSVKKNCVVIHSTYDKYVPFGDSVDLCARSGARLVAAGVDHRLNDMQAREALEAALWLVVGGVPN
jgi:hypothetical protein